MNKMDKYLQNISNTQEWVKCVSTNGGWKLQEKSFAALSATLQLLRKKLPKDISSYLGDQLPPMIREMYYEDNAFDYNLTTNSEEESFSELMKTYLKPRTDIIAEEAAYAVFKTIANKIPAEAVVTIKKKLPANIRYLWN